MWPRMYSEQAITRSARRTIFRSTAWMCDCGYLSTQPWWRPYSVAWTVTIQGTPQPRASGSAAPDTSQSCECTTSNSKRSHSSRPELQHVVVHRVDPAHEGRDVALRIGGLAHAVDEDAVALLVGGQPAAAARDHVHLRPVGDELLAQLAHVARESTLDDRRVLPGQQQDPHRPPQVIGHAVRAL